jgi:hypothetical protein
MYNPEHMPCRYPLIHKTVFQLARSLARPGRRSFHLDAAALAERLRPPLRILGSEYLPDRGPSLITVNHYTRPGFPSWWIALAASAAVPVEIHWVMTAAWVFPDNPRKDRLIAPLTRWVFHRLARVYGFTTMPPMPPRPQEVAERARAVREALAYACQVPAPVIGLAPEGSDSNTGVLQAPPPGVGRFLLHLAACGLVIVPAGVFETRDGLNVRFGPHFRLSLPAGLSKEAADTQASRVVMRAIASLLPVELQGEFQETI